MEKHAILSVKSVPMQCSCQDAPSVTPVKMSTVSPLNCSSQLSCSALLLGFSKILPLPGPSPDETTTVSAAIKTRRQPSLRQDSALSGGWRTSDDKVRRVFWRGFDQPCVDVHSLFIIAIVLVQHRLELLQWRTYLCRARRGSVLARSVERVVREVLLERAFANLCVKALQHNHELV